MEYLIGVILTLAVATFAAVIGFDRERAFYSTVLIVIASYYALFAVMGASTRTLIIESLFAGVFVLFAVLGFKGNYWLVVAALVGHGVFDFTRHFFNDNPGVPQWWPRLLLGFRCASGCVSTCAPDQAAKLHSPRLWSKGVSVLDDEAVLVKLDGVGGCQTRELLTRRVDHVQVAVRAVVPA
jgi:hypothetical protein